MRITKLSLQSSSFPALAAALLVAGFAPSQASAQDSVAEEDPAAEPQEQIVVTGSRIAISAATESASPITVIGGEDILVSGQADLATQLRNIPALQGSLPGIDSINQASPGDSSDLGLSLLNLRNLGAVRTLVLEDGRRHVPGTGGSAAVDIGAIPTGRIKSVEVLTGGASSIYGADAVTGVVNFTLRSGRDFDGLEFNVQGGISDEGDAENYSLSLAGGGEFMDGRGSAVFSVDYSRQKSIKASDRSFAGTGLFGLGFANQAIFDQLGLTDGDFGLPAGQRPSQAFYPNVTLPVSSRFGIIALDNGFASAFDAVNLINPNGSVPFLPGTNIPVAQVHAVSQGLTIDYRHTTAEDMAAAGEQFDVVLNMEVVEHVADLGREGLQVFLQVAVVAALAFGHEAQADLGLLLTDMGKLGREIPAETEQVIGHDGHDPAPFAATFTQRGIGPEIDLEGTIRFGHHQAFRRQEAAQAALGCPGTPDIVDMGRNKDVTFYLLVIHKSASLKPSIHGTQAV